jgi:hypothetical protein
MGSKYDQYSMFNSVMHFNKPIRFFSYEGIAMVTVNENGRFVKKLSTVGVGELVDLFVMKFFFLNQSLN